MIRPFAKGDGRVKKAKWKEIGRYLDLDGIRDHFRNRRAFQAFVGAFGWDSFLFSPVVYDYRKFFSGDPGYEKPARDAFGAARLPDRSLEGLITHPKAFRKDGAVVLTGLSSHPDKDLLDRWCALHSAVCVICPARVSFHRNGLDHLLLFMNGGTYERLRGSLAAFCNEVDVCGI